MTIDSLIHELYALVSDGYYSGAEITYKGHAITGIKSIVHKTPEEAEYAWELTDEVDMYEDTEKPKKAIDWEQRRFALVKDAIANGWDAEEALADAEKNHHSVQKEIRKEGQNND
jgi:hypothetical protein